MELGSILFLQFMVSWIWFLNNEVPCRKCDEEDSFILLEHILFIIIIIIIIIIRRVNYINSLYPLHQISV